MGESSVLYFLRVLYEKLAHAVMKRSYINLTCKCYIIVFQMNLSGCKNKFCCSLQDEYIEPDIEISHSNLKEKSCRNVVELRVLSVLVDGQIFEGVECSAMYLTSFKMIQ